MPQRNSIPLLSHTTLAGVLLLLCSAARLSAGAITLEFEGFPDSTVLTTQYPGVTFTNAIILTAGISLTSSSFHRIRALTPSRIMVAQSQSTSVLL